MPDDLGEIEKRATKRFEQVSLDPNLFAYPSNPEFIRLVNTDKMESLQDRVPKTDWDKVQRSLRYVQVLRDFNEKLTLTYGLGLRENADMTWGLPPSSEDKTRCQHGVLLGECSVCAEFQEVNAMFEKESKENNMKDSFVPTDLVKEQSKLKSVAASADNNNGAKEPRITVGSRVKVLRNKTSALVEPRHINGRLYARPAKFGDVVLVSGIVTYPSGRQSIKYAVGNGYNLIPLDDVEPVVDWVNRTSDFANSLTRCFRGAVPPQCCHALLSASFLQVGTSHGSFQMKNLQKAGIGLLGMLAVALALFGTDTFSYLSTGLGKVQDTARSAVSIQFELDRCKGIVDSLTPEIKKNNLTIATEEAEVSALGQKIAALEANMKVAKSEMMTLKSDLSDSGSVHFVYSGKSYTREQVNADLEARFEKYLSNEQELAAMQKTLEVRSKRLDGAKKLQSEYAAQQRQLNVTLETLKARLRMVEVAKTNNKCEFDSTKLGAAKKLAEQLTRRLEVEERTAGANTDSLTNGVQLTSEPDAKPITDRVAEHFEPSAVTVADSK